MPLSEDKHSLVSDGSEVGKEGSSAASVADSSDSSTVGSSNGSSGLSPHYDANQDVILRLEFLRTAEIKVRGIPSAGSASPLLLPPWGLLAAWLPLVTSSSKCLRRLALSLFTQAQQSAHASPLPRPCRPTSVQAIIRTVRVAVVAGLVMLIITLVFKIEKVPSAWQQSPHARPCCLAAEVPCMPLLLVFLPKFC